MKKFDVLIIGGGVVGCTIARELSRYELSVALLEKGCDVSSGTSKANSGVLHSGINSKPGSLKAKYCVEGNGLFDEICKELHVPMDRTGKLVVANEDEEDELHRLKAIGDTNGTLGLEIWDGERVQKKEPHVSCSQALWVPTAGIVSPYKLTIAMAESAAMNGVKFNLETKVKGITPSGDGYIVHTDQGDLSTSILINSAGVGCREIVSMAEEPDFQVYPCRGEYLVLDKEYQWLLDSMIYPLPPKEKGVLGVHITPTIEGNVILGPTAEFLDDGEDVSTTKDIMHMIWEEAKSIMPSIDQAVPIRAYSGMRCKLASREDGGWADFRIEESTQNKGMINLLGIESPGLTASPAIAKKVLEMVKEHLNPHTKNNFTLSKEHKHFINLTNTEREERIVQDPAWGRVVCRCESVTEAEILEALDNPLGSRTLSSVKYRSRAGSGRCQGGFCAQHVVRIMEERFGMKADNMNLKTPGSYLFTGKNRGDDQ